MQASKAGAQRHRANARAEPVRAGCVG